MTNDANNTPRLLVMLSGSGRTLANLIARVEHGSLPAQIAAVIANRECRGADIAREHEIPTAILQGDPDPNELDALIDQHRPDWIVLAGYLKLVPITDRTRGRVINVHPALLPDFGGPGMHGMRVHEAVTRAAARGEVEESGCTVHFADETYDTGPIILQRRCPAKPSDEPNELADRVFTLELDALPDAINKLIATTKPPPLPDPSSQHSS